MVQQFKETGHLILISTSALSRGILKRRGESTIHVTGDAVNLELLFQTGHSVKQSMRPSRIGAINSVQQMMKKNEYLFLWAMDY